MAILIGQIDILITGRLVNWQTGKLVEFWIYDCGLWNLVNPGWRTPEPGKRFAGEMIHGY
jgi:hypothetical protein